MRPCRPEPFCAVLNEGSLRIATAGSDCSDDRAISNMVPHSALGEVDILAVLNLVVWGVIITDPQGKPLLVNRAAGEIIAERDGLNIYSAKLAAARPCDTAAIRRLIAAASDTVDDKDSPGIMSLSRPSMRRPLAIAVSSLRTSRTWLAESRPSAIVFIRDPERAATVCPAFIQQLYCLTPAEAAVAALTASGDGLLGVCEKLQITQATARTHLQRVFRKTGTSRQAQLTRLLIESSFGLRLRWPANCAPRA
jgi:DNA-binding CsgD family transcriptional regulator